MMRTLQVGELSQVQGGGHGSGLAASLNLGGISVSTHVGLGSLSGLLGGLLGGL